ncbi:MAG: SUMF1/EgtB/PvdO family nonheme iron enzyme [Candidatus Riflebacteria bacterium]|nr:SUMF1/EgtB/PvdO family nonheme iron enzyme [Candidatus Riflebacteria bacterium]
MTFERCPACDHQFEAQADSPTTLVPCPRCSIRFLRQGTHHLTVLSRSAGSEPQSVGEVPLSREFLARYQPGWVLGTGAMGTVYLARDLTTGLPVALKILTRLGDADLLARFLREARLLIEIRHPNVVRVEEVSDLGGFPYMALELVDGGCLADHLKRRGALPPAEAVGLMEQLLAGLQACHSRGIIHRDLKPANVLMTRSGILKLADLGIAKDCGSGESTLTGTGTILGTPRYMSPEQTRGEVAVAASDIYSAGLIAFEMMTGRLPFTAANPLEWMQRHQNDRPMRLDQIAEGVPCALADVVDRAVGKRPGDRPGSAEELALALKRSLKKPQARVTPSPPASPRADPPAAGTAVLGLVAVLLALGLGLFTLGRRPAVPSPSASPGGATSLSPAPVAESPATLPPVPSPRPSAIRFRPPLRVRPPDQTAPFPRPAPVKPRFLVDRDLTAGEHFPALDLEWKIVLEGTLAPGVVTCPSQAEQPVVLGLMHSVGAGSTVMVALEPETGRELWRSPKSWTGDVVVVVLPFRVAVLAGGSSRLEVFDRITGRPVAELPLPAATAAPEVLSATAQEVALGGPGLSVEIRPELPWADGVPDGRAGLIVAARALAAGDRPLGAGRGLTLLKGIDGALRLEPLSGGQTLWRAVGDPGATRALVLSRHVVVGGATLLALDAATGRPLIEFALDGPVKRMEEQLGLLTVLHADDRAALFQLDSLRPIAGLSGVAGFEVFPRFDVFLGTDARLNLAPTSGWDSFTTYQFRTGCRPVSPGRVALQGNRVVLSADGPSAGSTAVQCHRLGMVPRPSASASAAPPQPVAPGAGAAIDDGPMVQIPGGAFVMGDERARPEGNPPRTVEVSRFSIDRYEVTNRRFRRFVEATGYRTEAERCGFANVMIGGGWRRVNGGSWQHPLRADAGIDDLLDHPAVHLSWDDAAAFCRWAGRRLPTEAEWERAARADDGRWYPWGTDSPESRPGLGNFADRSLRKTGVPFANDAIDDTFWFTSPAGRFPDGQSRQGVFDLAGNVWEWVADEVPMGPLNQPPPGTGAPGTPMRILKGGSCVDYLRYLPAWSRLVRPQTHNLCETGFRCAR